MYLKMFRQYLVCVFLSRMGKILPNQNHLQSHLDLLADAFYTIRIFCKINACYLQ